MFSPSHYKLWTAPLAGISDTLFRRICKEQGAEVCVSEMVSAEGIHYASAATTELCSFSEIERPFGVQLFGAKPDRLAEAAQWLAEKVKPDFIDLNSGCPVPKVIKKNGGAALLRDTAAFTQCVRALVRATPLPVTVKIRCGWDHSEYVDVDYARIAQDEGASAVILHARTRSMGYSGTAMWERIALVKQAVTIPIIGNGDVTTGEKALAMTTQTNCDGIMIGRGAFGFPWIFAQAKAAIDGLPVTPPTPAIRLAMALHHLELYREKYGERKACADMKKHVSWYIKGIPGAPALRNTIFRAASLDELEEILKSFVI